MHAKSTRKDNAKMERLRDWDIPGLVHNIDLEELKCNIAESSTSELIVVYKALSNVIDLCLHFANIPVVTIPLTELSYAYALELTNRFLVNGDDIGVLTSDELMRYLRVDS